MIRALIAEDSVTVRELLVAILDADPEIEIVGTAKNGREAVELTKSLRPDVVTMDVNMPELSGFEATKRIMIEVPTPIVIISASVEVNDVAVSMNALRLGALALLEKPPSADSPDFDASVARLTSTVKAMARVKVVRHWPSDDAQPTPPLSVARPSERVRIVALAASTGGPAALARVLSDLPAQFPAPILVVQHIATGFIQGLASWLNTVSSLRISVAKDGEKLTPSTVYLAGDGAHLGLGSQSKIKLDRSGFIDGFRPSATHLFDSVGRVFGPSSIGVILTGMGRDGTEGLRTIKASGGRVIAQDESTSVVFGMPNAAISQGLADCVLPLSAIGPRLWSWVHTC